MHEHCGDDRELSARGGEREKLNFFQGSQGIYLHAGEKAERRAFPLTYELRL